MRRLPLVFLIAGCTYSESSFQKHYAVAWCERAAECQTWQNLDTSEDECVEDQLRAFRISESDPLAFDSRAARSCIRALYDEDCSAGDMPPDCLEIYGEEGSGPEPQPEPTPLPPSPGGSFG